MNSQNNRSFAPTRRQRSINREAEEQEASYIFGEHTQPIDLDTPPDTPPSQRRPQQQPAARIDPVNDNAVDGPSANVAVPQNVDVS